MALGKAAVTGIGQLIGGLAGQNDPYNNPADAGMEYLDKIPGTVKPIYNPHIEAGQQSLSDLMAQYQALINNPGAKMNQIGEDFQKSPGYDFAMQNAMNGANTAAASGGMAGTPYHQQMASTLATQLANQDYYNWMDRSLGLYNTGINTASGINQQGYAASDALANILAGNLTNQAGMAYNGVANQNQAEGDKNNSFMEGLAGFAGSFFKG